MAMVKEFSAVVKYLAAEFESAPEGSGLKEILGPAEKQAESAPPSGIAPTSVEGLLARIRDAAALADTALAAESADDRRVLLEAAKVGIEASGSGFFGMGEKVSPEERVFLERLRGELGMS